MRFWQSQQRTEQPRRYTIQTQLCSPLQLSSCSPAAFAFFVSTEIFWINALQLLTLYSSVACHSRCAETNSLKPVFNARVLLACMRSPMSWSFFSYSLAKPPFSSSNHDTSTRCTPFFPANVFPTQSHQTECAETALLQALCLRMWTTVFMTRSLWWLDICPTHLHVQ